MTREEGVAAIVEGGVGEGGVRRAAANPLSQEPGDVDLRQQAHDAAVSIFPAVAVAGGYRPARDIPLRI